MVDIIDHPGHPDRVASGVRKIIDHQFFPPYYRLIIDFSTLYRPILSIFLKGSWKRLTLTILNDLFQVLCLYLSVH